MDIAALIVGNRAFRRWQFSCPVADAGSISSAQPRNSLDNLSKLVAGKSGR
jgi:hypothetical protein